MYMCMCVCVHSLFVGLNFMLCPVTFGRGLVNCSDISQLLLWCLTKYFEGIFIP